MKKEAVILKEKVEQPFFSQKPVEETERGSYETEKETDTAGK